MVEVTLVYPYFRPSNDNSIFRFPPLGLGYLAAYLRKNGVSVNLVDCTFLDQQEALNRIRKSNPRIIGVQSMFSMKNKSIELAEELRKDCETLVTGGPLPTTSPEDFLSYFDIVVNGEGEVTLYELVQEIDKGGDLSRVKGIWYRENGKIRQTPPREGIHDLDSVPFPFRDFFDNKRYQNYYSSKFGYSITSVMTSRGCPFNCDFCSKSVFGNSFRTRSAQNVIHEIEAVEKLGYARIWFADDCFTFDPKRLVTMCDEMIRSRLGIGWECLSRVDTVNDKIARKMRQAGCIRIFFGIESGNDTVLAIMKKHATIRQAEEAVHAVKQAGIQTGAFFIVGYPGENSTTILDTIRFASSLPLDYLSFTMPYAIPGTPLFDRVSETLAAEEWEEPKNLSLIKHKLLFASPFSERKLKLAISKGMIQHYLRKYLGSNYTWIGKPFEVMTDSIFQRIT
jgi:anaerobic magnesium-protoporphyrin IX monomethyl ester cyclase